jgi:hypothetical protein
MKKIIMKPIIWDSKNWNRICSFKLDIIITCTLFNFVEFYISYWDINSYLKLEMIFGMGHESTYIIKHNPSFCIQLPSKTNMQVTIAP